MSESSSEQPIVARWRSVRASIADACARAGRDAAGVNLLAVSKTHPADAARSLLEIGQRDFGENRVQEALGKWPALKSAFPQARLHLIGPLQTNKVRDAVALFDAIETVDRPRLADALAHEMERTGRRLDCYIEVNIGAEPQKAGVLPDAADAFIEDCRTRLALPVAGLMCIPPDGADATPHFRTLAAIASRHGLTRLSMGMSGDFEKAIAAGSTEVRVGTAIFGARPAHP